MSVAQCSEINARLRSAGITVREASGWQSRGNGQTSAYVGGIVHHTATGFGIAMPGTGPGNLLINGRPDLSGPLCNYAGNDDGSITVIAAHPANHAGASGGRSMGPLPVTTLFNPRVLGLEIVYPGTQPMKPAQFRAATVWARVVADVVGGGNIERVRAHAETSVTGKWDPGSAPNTTIDMTAFRRAAKTALQEDDMTPDELMKHRVKDATYDEVFGHAFARMSQATERLFTMAPQLAAIQGALTGQEARILAAINADTDAPVDVPALADALRETLAAEFIDELVDRLSTKEN